MYERYAARMILILLSLILAANPSQDVAKVLDTWHLAGEK
jgi:hypothetical protein